ncbi:hypothetical protein [Paraburkholderia diazotrophica]|uniref:hypothetical protein n=1 Tax=Paraburkholderia diazotrophica TaxID=667676 RepID=UPI00317723CF
MLPGLSCPGLTKPALWRNLFDREPADFQDYASTEIRTCLGTALPSTYCEARVCRDWPRGVGSGWTLRHATDTATPEIRRQHGADEADRRTCHDRPKIRDCERRIAEQKRRVESISKSLSIRQHSETLHKNLTVSLKTLHELRIQVMKEVEEAETGRVRFSGQ